MKSLFLMFLLFIADAAIAIAQQAAVQPQVPNFLEQITKGDFVMKILGIMVGLQLMLYAMAEGLTRISVYTETHWDNKVAAWFSQAAWLLGSILGKFGYSTPKLVIEEKAEQLAQKK